jgi:DNA-binding XRE family transcriptional regulator
VKCNTALLHKRAAEMGMNIYQLAEAARIGEKTAMRAWTGSNIYFVTACAIALALKVDVEALTGETLTLGGRLMCSRLSRGLNRFELAELSGVSDGTISQWESSGKIPQLLNAYHVASALDMSLEECFGLSNYKQEGVAE